MVWIHQLFACNVQTNNPKYRTCTFLRSTYCYHKLWNGISSETYLKPSCNTFFRFAITHKLTNSIWYTVYSIVLFSGCIGIYCTIWWWANFCTSHWSSRNSSGSNRLNCATQCQWWIWGRRALGQQYSIKIWQIVVKITTAIQERK